MSQILLKIIDEKDKISEISKTLDTIGEENAMAVTMFEENNKWVWGIYIENKQVEKIKENIQKIIGGNIAIIEETVPDKNWVEESLKNLKPIRAGRFYIYGSHNSDSATNEKFGIMINAAMAFGTGHHETTSGCLEMLEEILKMQEPKKIYDIGTGSGILAIAAAKATKADILASDNDEVAVKIAKENIKVNKSIERIELQVANGCSHRCFGKFGKAELIMANILAEPLRLMAQELSAQLTIGGYVILAGLLTQQKNEVVKAYNDCNLNLEKEIFKNEWCILLMKKIK